MAKPFKTIDEQYDLLLNRGIVFKDADKAKRHLIQNNYYKVINCYGKFFTVKNSDHYIPGTNFEEITEVQYFDEELKNILFKYIIEVEKHFKSIVSYHFSNQYADNYSYLMANNFKKDDLLEVTTLISSLSKTIKKYKNYNFPNSIKHYVNNHNNVPLWVLCDYMSLGEIIRFFEHLEISIQNKIAKDISHSLHLNLEISNARINPNQIISCLNNIREVRNAVAHNNRILDFKCRRNISYIKDLHSKYAIAANHKKSDIYHIYIALQCFLTTNQFAQLHNAFRKKIRNLDKKLSTIDCNIILKSLGFPDDWYNISKINQENV